MNDNEIVEVIEVTILERGERLGPPPTPVRSPIHLTEENLRAIREIYGPYPLTWWEWAVVAFLLLLVLSFFLMR